MERSVDRVAALNDVVRRFGEAWAGGDVVALEQMLSPTYTHTDAYGALLHRAEWLRYTGGRAGRSTRIAFKDVSTRIEGDVAVVTGINELTGAGVRDVGDGAALVIRFTQVWTWKDGRWQREAFQATPVAQIAQFT